MQQIKNATHVTRGIASAEWPLKAILEHDYAIATIYVGDVAPDYADGDTTGIH